MKQTEVAPERKYQMSSSKKGKKHIAKTLFLCLVGKLVKFPAIYTNIQDRTQKSINLFFNRFSQHIVEHYNYVAAILADPP